ncbi:hypothetical protein GCM10010324_55170 [Streptomyces hiroshimensis]|uniref:Uncharacterized protein n=1 Tax=Streptomyces hiroshimensis TaxID=66424 RepID=A0ABQ2Z397_9ACTN|nr:hypothetical protein GCM10010324_55170 [Streptomyces hiroshimensis]
MLGVVDQIHDAQQCPQKAIALGVHPFREHRTDFGVASEKDCVEVDRYLPRKGFDHREGGPYEVYLVIRQRCFGGLRLSGMYGLCGLCVPWVL